MRVARSLSLLKMPCIAALLIAAPLVVIAETASAVDGSGSGGGQQADVCNGIYGFCLAGCRSKVANIPSGFSHDLSYRLCEQTCDDSYVACLDGGDIAARPRQPRRPVATTRRPVTQSESLRSSGKSKPPEGGLLESQQGSFPATGPAAAGNPRGSGGPLR